MACRMGWIWCLAVVVALLGGASAAIVRYSEVYEVGGSLGWTVPPNTSYYSEWASNKTFFVGDGFFFNWASGTNSVSPVPKVFYDDCTKTGFSMASPGTITPKLAGSYYFICPVDDHCERGLKVAVNVLPSNITPEWPGEPLTSSASSLSIIALFAVLSITTIYFLTSV